MSAPSDDPAAASEPTVLGRRAMLAGGFGLALGAAAGVGIAVTAGGSAEPTGTVGQPLQGWPVDVHGAQQAGIARPPTPQRFGLLHAVDLAEPGDVGFLADTGAVIATIVAGTDRDVAPDGPGDLTIAVGLGPRVVAAVDDGLPGSEDLPEFRGDEAIATGRRGGDVLLAAYASDPGLLAAALARVAATIPGATLRWSQRVFRGPGEGTAVRNPLGFRDGIVVPRGDAELAANVWLDHPTLAGATICVVRRLRLDVERFTALPVPARERIIGRRHGDGAPLSGGGPDDEVNLVLKSPDGEYLVPARAHARAAHPSFTASALMLRRGYQFDDGDGDAGLLFVCFQRDLRTFVATQQRLDEVDDLMDYATPTGSATFLILPGFDVGRPLGAALQR